MPTYEFHLLLCLEDFRVLTEAQWLDVATRAGRDCSTCKLSATRTAAGVACFQPMITGTLCAPGDEGARQIVALVSARLEVMRRAGIIMRTKIERLTSPAPKRVTGDDYFEYHMKITHHSGVKITTRSAWEALAELCFRHRVPLLFNPYSLTPAPVTTMRLYDMTHEEARNLHEALKGDLQCQGYTIMRTHAELGILDTNPGLDEGWLYTTDSYKDRTPAQDLRPPAEWIELMQVQRDACHATVVKLLVAAWVVFLLLAYWAA